MLTFSFLATLGDALEVSLISLSYPKFPWPTNVLCYGIFLLTFFSASRNCCSFYPWLLHCWVQFTHLELCLCRTHAGLPRPCPTAGNGGKNYCLLRQMMRVQDNLSLHRPLAISHPLDLLDSLVSCVTLIQKVKLFWLRLSYLANKSVDVQLNLNFR